jgi:hypothetical protein
MADRYWVGGTASWDGTAGTKWAASSGGTGGESVPTTADDVFFTNLSTGTVTIAAGNTGAKSINCTGFTGTIAGTAAITVAGSITLSAGMTYTYTGNLTISASGTIITAGITLTSFVIINTIGTVQLGDAFTSSSTLNLTQGTFDAAGYNVTARIFFTSNVNVRTLYMGSGLWTLTGPGTLWNSASSTNLTLDKGTANILLSDISTTLRTVSGGGVSLNKLTIGGATGTSTTNLTGLNLTELASTKTVAHTVALGSSAVTVGTWSITGTSGNVVTFNSSTAGTQRTLGLTNVTSGVDYLAVKDIAVSDPNKFYVGANSTDSGNNSNVYFTDTPVVPPSSTTFFKQVFSPVFHKVFSTTFS